jgi:hypothetical protein
MARLSHGFLSGGGFSAENSAVPFPCETVPPEHQHFRGQKVSDFLKKTDFLANMTDNV